MMWVDPKTPAGKVWLDREGRPIDTARAELAAARQADMSRRAQALAGAAGLAPVEPGWYALIVRDGSERVIGSALQEAGWSTWVATETVRQRQRGKTVERRRSVLPGYVLTHLPWSAEIFHVLRDRDGLFGIVGGWEAPHRIGEADIARVKALFALTPVERRREAVRHLGIGVGDMVEITAGPFAALRGDVVEEADAVSMWVEIMLFGRAAPVRVDLANLTRIGLPSRP